MACGAPGKGKSEAKKKQKKQGKPKKQVAARAAPSEAPQDDDVWGAQDPYDDSYDGGYMWDDN